MAKSKEELEKELAELQKQLTRVERRIDTHRKLIIDLEERCERVCGKGWCTTKNCNSCNHEADKDHSYEMVKCDAKIASRLRRDIYKLEKELEKATK